MALATASLVLGQKARVLSSQEVGTVRYVGETKFSAGEWIGLQLATAKGKNDGSVQGIRYFTCPPNHGIFVKKDAVEPFVAAKPPPAAISAAGGSRKSILGFSGRKSMAAGPIQARSGVSGRPSTSHEASKEVEGLQTELERAGIVRGKLEEKVKNLTETTSSKNEEIENLVKKLNEATAARKAAEERAEEALKEKEDAESRFEIITNYKLDLQDRYERLEADHNALTEKVSDLELDLGHAKADLELNQQREIEATDDPQYAVRLATERDALKEVFDKARDKIIEQNNTIKQLKEDAEQSAIEHTENLELKEQIRKLNETVNEQAAIIQSNDAQEAVIENIQAKNDTLTEELNETKSALEDANLLNATNDEVIEAQEAMVRDLQASEEKNEGIVDQLQQELKTSNDKVIDYEATIVKFRQTVSEYQETLKEALESKASSEEERIKQEKKMQNAITLLHKTIDTDRQSQVEEFLTNLLKKQVETIKLSSEIYSYYGEKRYGLVTRPIQALLIMSDIQNQTDALGTYLLRRAQHDHDPDLLNPDVYLFKCIMSLKNIGYKAEFLNKHFKNATLAQFMEFGDAYDEITTIMTHVDSWTKKFLSDEPEYQKYDQAIEKDHRFLKLLVDKHIPEAVTKGPLGVGCTIKGVTTALECFRRIQNNLEATLGAKFKLADNHEDLDRVEYFEHLSVFKAIADLRSKIERSNNTIVEFVEAHHREGKALTEEQNQLYTDCHKTIGQANAFVMDVLQRATDLKKELGHDGISYLDLSPLVGPLTYEPLVNQLVDIDAHLKKLRLMVNDAGDLDEAPEENTVAPWIAYANMIIEEDDKSRKIRQELAAAKAELAEKNTAIAVKNKTIDELQSNNEVLTKRATDTTTSTAQTKALTSENDNLKAESAAKDQHIQRITTELTEAKSKNENISSKVNSQQSSMIPGPSRKDNGVSKAHLEGLQHTLRATRSGISGIPGAVSGGVFGGVVVGVAGEDLARPKARPVIAAAGAIVRLAAGVKMEEKGKGKAKPGAMRVKARAAEAELSHLRRKVSMPGSSKPI